MIKQFNFCEKCYNEGIHCNQLLTNWSLRCASCGGELSRVDQHKLVTVYKYEENRDTWKVFLDESLIDIHVVFPIEKYDIVDLCHWHNPDAKSIVSALSNNRECVIRIINMSYESKTYRETIEIVWTGDENQFIEDFNNAVYKLTSPECKLFWRKIKTFIIDDEVSYRQTDLKKYAGKKCDVFENYRQYRRYCTYHVYDEAGLYVLDENFNEVEFHAEYSISEE